MTTIEMQANRAFEFFKSLFNYDPKSDWLIDDVSLRSSTIRFDFDPSDHGEDLPIKLCFDITESGILNIHNVLIPKEKRNQGIITKTFGFIKAKKVQVVDSINDDAWIAIGKKLKWRMEFVN